MDFARDVLPVLSNQCFRCHGPDEEERGADLRLDVAESALEDRGGYAAIVPGDVSASAVMERVLTDDPDLRMPPADSGLSLTDQQKQLLADWIQGGAGYEQHWSFRPVQRPSVPGQKGEPSAIDAFVRVRLEEAGLQPSPAAERSTLIRRVYLDVLGLPPTPQQVQTFEQDESPGAVATMVDQALASPHYGEKWGRHWLDQARYADSNGYTIDSPRTMWPYRDWVINAVNADMPFDRFTIEQLAGDLLDDPTDAQRIATGFHRNTLINQEGGTDDEQFRNEAVVDRVNTTGAVWLGLTVGCAQCHSHKYDPLTQHEYYQLFAFFNSGTDVNSTSPTILLPSSEQQQKLEGFAEQIAELLEPVAEFDRRYPQDQRTPEQQQQRDQLAAPLTKLRKQRDRFRKSIPAAMVMQDRQQPRETHVLIRGDFLRPGDEVLPGTPAFLPSLDPDTGEHDDPDDSTEGTGRATRLNLARWLVSRDNPLTARVFVNRVWMRLFGQGLVETENDFGLQGTAPTHPLLLDWLATEFMEHGWSQKHLIRTILLSATYQQSSQFPEQLQQVDPRNKLLARQSRVRVDAEGVRDLALSVSGLLTTTIGGPGVYPPQPDGVYAFTQRKASWPASTGPDRYRRGMYTFFFRSAPHPLLTTFDSPAFNTTCTRRVRSNTPLQALTVANDEALVEAAQALGRRIVASADNDAERINKAWLLCFSRRPTPEEVKRLQTFLSAARADFAGQPMDALQITGSKETTEDTVLLAAWVSTARGILNLDEFITRE